MDAGTFAGILFVVGLGFTIFYNLYGAYVQGKYQKLQKEMPEEEKGPD